MRHLEGAARRPLVNAADCLLADDIHDPLRVGASIEGTGPAFATWALGPAALSTLDWVIHKGPFFDRTSKLGTASFPQWAGRLCHCHPLNCDTI
jgi:hypothetical protein